MGKILKDTEFIEGRDFILNEAGYVVLSLYFQAKKGFCCGNKCLNCAYEPRYQKDNSVLSTEGLEALRKMKEETAEDLG